MSTVHKVKLVRQKRRKARMKGMVRGTTERPRLRVFRSIKNISAQIIDDTAGVTLVAASSAEKSFRTSAKHGGNVSAATQIGKQIAERAVAKGIKQVAFDRGGCKYHGRIKALAQAARDGGLQF
jgi:large subunit ribosomal protein L18